MMRVGIIGTGAISRKQAEAYRNIGFQVAVCTDINPAAGEKFAAETGAKFVASYEELCRHPEVDFVDVCTLPNFRLQAVRACAGAGKHIVVQKPMATDLSVAREMIEVARQRGILLGVVSQHRFDDSTLFLKQAIEMGRLGRLIQIDAYVKWWRSAEYFSRPIKGSWAVEGGGALINQAIHQIDLILYLAGSVSQVFGYWQLGAVHKIESEDNLSAVLQFASGANGVIQASTALWPGYPERLEIHGTKGSAIVTGDKLTTWDVQDDAGEPAPLVKDVASGASDPMAISLLGFERQLLDFGQACKNGTRPMVTGEDGYRALQLVNAIYNSCRQGEPIDIEEDPFLAEGSLVESAKGRNNE
jgi:UDP-N-acetyl-2-amino-2-deoxyglucuronate dehydrogenase